MGVILLGHAAGAFVALALAYGLARYATPRQ